MKMRLDVLLVSRGMADSREKARAMIMAGEIFVNGSREDKPGSSFEENADIAFHGKTLPYVSRGGLKLEKAIREFSLDLNNRICLDIGASTGGFTDCMLQNGAEKVTAIDVGYGQLAYKLRTDPKVVCMEKTNIRYVTPEQIGMPADFASVDVSFISLKLVLPPLKALLKADADVICLVKPQFEAGREKIGKKGVVRDPSVHEEVLSQICEHAIKTGFTVKDMSFSPIKGPEGNIEYLLWLKNSAGTADSDNWEDVIRQTVCASHEALDVEK